MAVQSSTQIPVSGPGSASAAVAADANSNGDHEDEDGSDKESVGGRSGDTAGSRTDEDIRRGDLSAVAARRTEMARPGSRITGDMHPYREPAERNKRPDVGNFSMLVGNWGERSSVEGFAQRDLYDANVKGSPGELVVLFEATHAVAEMLESQPSYVQEPPQQRSLPNQKAVPGNMWQREHYEHHVIMTQDSKNAILMAARTNVCEGIEELHTASWCDGTWRVSGNLKTATTRVMICKFKWKQSIGHLGNEVTVMGVHGHYRTMNMLFAAKVNNELWIKIHALIVAHNVNFLVGDWNMSLPQVVPRLSDLGLRVDLCAWYPWLHETQEKDGYYFGMDSCAMFYIGGDVACQLTWDYYSIGDILKDAACDPKQRPRSRPDGPVFDVYCGEKNGSTFNVPGQLWDKFKNKRHEKGSVNLKTKLEGLLLPSTTSADLAALAADIARRGDGKTTYLKLKQKPTDQNEWLLDPVSGATHPGAHFPLFLVTQNRSRRSEEADERRSQKYIQRGRGSGRSRGRGASGQMQSPVSAANDQAALPWGDTRWASGRDRSWWNWSSEWSHGDWQSDASWWH